MLGALVPAWAPTLNVPSLRHASIRPASPMLNVHYSNHCEALTQLLLARQLEENVGK